MALRFLALFVGAALLVAACASAEDSPLEDVAADTAGPAESSVPTGPTTTLTPPETVIAPEPLNPRVTSCLPGRADRISVEVDGGGQRIFQLDHPGTDFPLPAVIALHGFTGSPGALRETSGLSDFVLNNGGIVAYPEGTMVEGGGFGWNANTESFSTTGTDDVAFILEVWETLVLDHCANPEMVLLTGESNGGGLAVAAFCDLRVGGRFELIAPVIAAVGPDTVGSCVAPPSRLLSVAGTADRVVGFGEGGVDPHPDLLAEDSWFTAAAAFVNSCVGATREGEVEDGVSAVVWDSCRAQTTQVIIEGGDHTWPGGPSSTGDMDPGDWQLTPFLWDALVDG